MLLNYITYQNDRLTLFYACGSFVKDDASPDQGKRNVEWDKFKVCLYGIEYVCDRHGRRVSDIKCDL